MRMISVLLLLLFLAAGPAFAGTRRADRKLFQQEISKKPAYRALSADKKLVGI